MQNQCVSQMEKPTGMATSQTTDVVNRDHSDRHSGTTRNGSQEMLRIDVATKNTFATLICTGHLTFGVETETLRTMVQSRPEENLRLDLSGVQKIDAAGLGLLVELQLWAREEGRTLRLVDPSEDVWRMVILTKLYSALEISYTDAAGTHHEHKGVGYDEMIA